MPLFVHSFSLLIAPTKPSFISQEETALARIGRLPKNRQRSALLAHAKKYSWIRNSYAGPASITLVNFEQRMENPSEPWESPARERKAMIRTLKLGAHTQQILDIIDFTAIWQDQRKENILRMVGTIGALLAEISRRTGIAQELLPYCGVSDVWKTRSLSHLASLEETLGERKKGVFFLMDGRGERAVSGAAYRALLPMYTTHHVTSGEGERELHVARELNIPTVIGTKIATAALRDGMIVEIRAHHGLVRILD